MYFSVRGSSQKTVNCIYRRKGKQILWNWSSTAVFTLPNQITPGSCSLGQMSSSNKQPSFSKQGNSVCARTVRASRGVEVQLFSTEPRYQMGMTGQLHAQTVIPMGKQQLVSNDYETRWVPEQICVLWRGQRSFISAGNRTATPRSSGTFINAC